MKTETKTTDKDISVMRTQGEWETGSKLPGDEYKCCILNDENRLLAQTFTNPYYSVETAEANAACICKCVNGYDKLLEENEVLKSAYKGAGSVVSRLGEENKRLREALQQIYAKGIRLNPKVNKAGDDQISELWKISEQALNNNINLQK